MRRFLILAVALVLVFELLALVLPTAGAQEPRTAKPRQPAPAREPARAPKQVEPSRRPDSDAAKERPADSQAKPRTAQPRVAPPRTPPPDYFGPRRVYVFPPVSRHRTFYYHPYFGFYFGPYYGPYYPYPGPHAGPQRFTASAVRTRVRPVETEVYVNGYYAGAADDFDGSFQRLYLPSGVHEIELFLEGYQSYREVARLAPGETFELRHQMLRLTPGQVSRPPLPPRAVPDEWRSQPDDGRTDRPASPDGVLSLHVETPESQVFVDDELWLGTEGQTAFVIHIPAGTHVIEVRKPGHQTFRTEVALSAGSSVQLSVHLLPNSTP
jgi:hypothetical protein